MEERICNCNIPRNLQQDMMYQKIREYIEALDPEQCVSDLVYERRLNLCSTCDALVGGLTCSYCGCFVLARAKKNSQSCPKPGGGLWGKEEMQVGEDL